MQDYGMCAWALHLNARDHPATLVAGPVKIDAGLSWDWMHHLDLVNVMSGKLGCL